MKLLFLAAVGAVAAAGCNALQPAPDTGAANRALAESLGDESIRNAIIRQHTLHPYHFTPNDAVLNELGRRDLQVLINHFSDHPGTLNIRRGAESEHLYDARLRHVMKLLTDSDVEARKMTFDDDLPGGSGMESREVIEILRPAKAPAPAWSASTPIVTGDTP